MPFSPGFPRVQSVITMRRIPGLLLFLAFLVSVPDWGIPETGNTNELHASSVYFPSNLTPKFRKIVEPCVRPALPPFRFRRYDLDSRNLRNVFQRLKARSQKEGKLRADSVRCLRNLDLTDKQKENMKRALESMFQVEKNLFFNYTRFLDQATGMDRTRNASFLKSRYDLMIILQTKTLDWVLEKEEEDESVLEKDFSNLYLSILRTYYDFFLELDPATLDHYFKTMEGKI